jgi:hypothetical protein
MKTLWTFGCSFTAEYYPVDHKFIRSHYDDYKDWRGGTLPDVWPTLLGKKLNLEVKNMAFGGDSNYSIFDQFLNVVDLIREGDMVIFGWTHVVRFQAANPDSRNGFNQILPSITDYPETGLSIKTVEEILVNRSNSIWIKEVLNWIKFINLYMEKSKINIFITKQFTIMGYLNSQVISTDSILTTKGRELLSKGNFKITQFALSDDEIDYTLYNPNHPSGSAFFGEAIEAMPLLEAFTDETQMMKYKLLTLPRGTSKLPVLNIGYSAVSLRQTAAINITPQKLNYIGATSTFEPSGYMMTEGDSRFLSTFSGTVIDTTGLGMTMSTPNASGASLSISQIGTSFSLIATTINTLFGTSALPGATITTTITVMGRDSGARLTIPLTIIKS